MECTGCGVETDEAAVTATPVRPPRELLLLLILLLVLLLILVQLLLLLLILSVGETYPNDASNLATGRQLKAAAGCQ